MRIYKTLEELERDMELMFDNWIALRGTEHKMYKHLVAVRTRFQKYIEKLKGRKYD